MWLAALSDDAPAVIVEISKAISAALNELHLSVEALGEAVIFCKAPHGNESVSPRVKRFGQADEGLERAEPEFINQGNEVADMAATGSGGLVFEAEQLPEFENFVIDGSKGKLTLEEADDMEPISNDASMGEPSPSQGSVRTGEVHADHLHLLPAFERGEEPSQLGLATPRDKVKNPVITQVAKCRGERHPTMDAMFVDPEDAGTLQTLTFTGLARGELRINASYACVA